MSAARPKNVQDPRGDLIVAPLLLAALIVSMASCNKQESASEKPAPKTFASPDAAGAALFDAAKAGDQNALVALFGSGGKDLVFSGDAVKDKNTAQRFVAHTARCIAGTRANPASRSSTSGPITLPFPSR